MSRLLKKVPKLCKVSTKDLQKVGNVVEVKYFSPGTVIVKEGDRGDKFYIIRSGSVTITRKGEGVVGNYGKGQFFGELMFLKEKFRQATVTADAPTGVKCLTLERQHFMSHFGELREDGITTVQTSSSSAKMSKVMPEHQDVELKDLSILTTLGVGQHKSAQKLFS
jgi:cGMP-dependent protein kinase